MLMPGSRKNLFKTAYDEMEDILTGVEERSIGDKKELTQKIIDGAQDSNRSFVHDAWLLTKG